MQDYIEIDLKETAKIGLDSAGAKQGPTASYCEHMNELPLSNE